jgi:hypothetical protein
MTRTVPKSQGVRALQHDRHLARNGRSNSQKKVSSSPAAPYLARFPISLLPSSSLTQGPPPTQDGFKLWGDISHHHQHLDPEDIAPPAQDDNHADWEDEQDGEEPDEMDEEERQDAREDAKVDKVWLATLDVYLAMVTCPFSRDHPGSGRPEEDEEACRVLSSRCRPLPGLALKRLY